MIRSLAKLALSFAALVLLALLAAAPALAVSKAWVSNAGVDGPSCGAVTAPCATFQRAHNNAAAGGEVGVLTPGDYGLVNVNKSVNLTNDGTGEASILIPTNGGTGVFILAGAGDIVSLRGLVIDGQGIGGSGIDFQSGAALHVQNCVVRNFEGSGTSIGIAFQPSGNTQLFVSDTIVFNNGSNAASAGILIQPTAPGNVRIALDRVHVENNVQGIKVDGTFGTGGSIRVGLRDSAVSGNLGNGVWSFRPIGSGASTVVIVNRTAVVNNAGAGVLADGGGIVLLDDSAVVANGTGASVASGGRLLTYGNNVIDNNVGEDLSPAAIARTTK